MNFKSNYHEPFSCAHTPSMTRWFPVTFRFIDMVKANTMQDCKWFYRLWIYTWFGQWVLDFDGGRK